MPNVRILHLNRFGPITNHTDGASAPFEPKNLLYTNPELEQITANHNINRDIEDITTYYNTHSNALNAGINSNIVYYNLSDPATSYLSVHLVIN